MTSVEDQWPFERLLREMQELKPPEGERARRIRWIGDATGLGVARDALGGYEIFLNGPQLRVTVQPLA